MKGGVPLAAHISGLKLQPDEIASVRKKIPNRKGIKRTLQVAEEMAEDQSLGANFRSAPKLAGVKRQDVIDVARATAEVRREREAEKRKLVQEIWAAHQAHMIEAHRAAVQRFEAESKKAAGASKKRMSRSAFGRALKKYPKLRAVAETRPAEALGQLVPKIKPPAPVPALKIQTFAESMEWAAIHAPAKHDQLMKMLPMGGGANPWATVDLSTLGIAPAPAPRAGTFAEFTPLEPVGRLFLERIEMTPVGMERGELVHSVPLTPQEEVNISHREWSQQSNEFDQVIEDQLDGYSEKGVAEKADISRATSTESKHSTALNVGASLSANFSYVTLSSSFGYSAT